MARRTWNLLGVPIDSVAEPGGTELGPEALLAAGLTDLAPLIDHGSTVTQLRDPRRDPESGVVAFADVLELSDELRDEVAELADSERPLLVLGGCCTALPGVIGGLRAAGKRLRLVYLDGHLDLYDGESSPGGEAADMPLAVMLGLGPRDWAASAGVAQPLDPADLALLGPRDREEARELGSALPDEIDGVSFLDGSELRDEGPAHVGERFAVFGAEAPDGFWVHLDLDLLDEEEFPATDAFVEDGLRWDELEELLGPLVSHPACLGLDLTCFNPEKDVSGRYAHRIVELLGATLG